MWCREFNKNLVRPRTNTEVAGFTKKKKGKKYAAATDDNMSKFHSSSCAHASCFMLQQQPHTQICSDAS